tara:strand:+ start:607 stop:933 length:327 start_codon:yes stop_codon:yes gene_type:complete
MTIHKITDTKSMNELEALNLAYIDGIELNAMLDLSSTNLTDEEVYALSTEERRGYFEFYCHETGSFHRLDEERGTITDEIVTDDYTDPRFEDIAEDICSADTFSRHER